MKNIFYVMFVLSVFTLTVPAQGQLVCGAPGTEGLPKCTSVSSMKIGDCITVGAENKDKCKPSASVSEKCCIPPSSNVKTVSKSGGKTNAHNNNSVVNQVVVNAEPQEPAMYAPAPVNTFTPGVINKAPAQVTVNKMHPAVVAATAASGNSETESSAGTSSAAVAVSSGLSSSAAKSAKASK